MNAWNRCCHSPIPLYRHERPSGPLVTHMTKTPSTSRQRILSIVTANPGIHIRRLSLLVGLSWNTCQHHLRVLQQRGDVSRRKINGKVCWFDARNGAFQRKRATCLLRDPQNMRLAQAILQEPGSNQLHLAQSLELAASAVHRRVTRMEEAGLVVRMPESRSVHVFPSNDMRPVAEQAGLLPRADVEITGAPEESVVWQPQDPQVTSQDAVEVSGSDL